MQYWKAHYKDKLHDLDIKILNTEEGYETEPLSFTVDNIRFHGTSLGDFHLSDDEQYEEASRKFHILKWGGNWHFKDDTVKTPYFYDLQRYSLDVEIPVKVVRKFDSCELIGILHIFFEYIEHNKEKIQSTHYCNDEQVYIDDYVVYDFSLNIDGKLYKSEKMTLYFEAALMNICKQMKNEYYMKCCFTCQYSEYSPYGNDDYGIMLCYNKYKEDCLKVNNKDDYFEYLEAKDFIGRQETYLCNEYMTRSKSSGYRGFVEGVCDTSK